MRDDAVVDLRKDQPWLLLPKAALDALAQETLREGRGLGMLYGYRRAVERQARERAFRQGIHFALNVLQRFANSPEDTDEWRRDDQRRDQAT